MSLSLTTDDLQAIKGIVDDAVDQAMLQTAAGFAVVDSRLAQYDARFDRLESRADTTDSRLDRLQDTVDRIERVQRAEIARTDGHGRDIALIKRKLALN